MSTALWTVSRAVPRTASRTPPGVTVLPTAPSTVASIAPSIGPRTARGLASGTAPRVPVRVRPPSGRVRTASRASRYARASRTSSRCRRRTTASTSASPLLPLAPVMTHAGTTSATTQLTLSGPPASMASATRSRTARSGSAPEVSTRWIASVGTTADRPSEHSR
jgi:hypothetical protein